MAAKINMVLDDKEFQRYMTLVLVNVGNTRPIMIFGVSVMSQSTAANFRAGGRMPFKWRGLSPMTIKGRRTENPPTWPASPLGQPILQRHGTLVQSLLPGNQNGFLLITKKFVEYGTKLIKARGLQFGLPARSGVAKVPSFTRGGSTVKAHTRRFRFGAVPSRPFLYFRPEDTKKIMAFAFAFAFQPGVAAKFGKVPTTGSIPSNLFMGVG